MLEAATTSAQVSGVIYSTHLCVPWRAGSLLYRQLPGVRKRAWSPCDSLYSKLCPVADGSFLQVTYWLWVHVGRVWLCSVFWAHHLLSHSHCHPGPRQYQIGSSSVENYEQIKKDYSCEMNQSTVSTFSISFGIKHLLRFIFFILLGWQLRRQGPSSARTSGARWVTALPASRGIHPTEQSFVKTWPRQRRQGRQGQRLSRCEPWPTLTTWRTCLWCAASSTAVLVVAHQENGAHKILPVLSSWPRSSPSAAPCVGRKIQVWAPCQLFRAASRCANAVPCEQALNKCVFVWRWPH